MCTQSVSQCALSSRTSMQCGYGKGRYISKKSYSNERATLTNVKRRRLRLSFVAVNFNLCGNCRLALP